MRLITADYVHKPTSIGISLFFVFNLTKPHKNSKFMANLQKTIKNEFDIFTSHIRKTIFSCSV